MFHLFMTLLFPMLAMGQPWPKLDIYKTQSGYGYFRLVGFNNKEIKRLSSVWLQNDEKKQLKITTGEVGEKGWMAAFWFFEGKVYEVRPGTNGDPECTLIDDYGYDEEIRAYNYSALSHWGNLTMVDHNNARVSAFAGQVLDGVGPLNVVVYTQIDDGRFYGMLATGGYGTFAFNEYWYGDNSSAVVPPESAFEIHPSCKNPKTKHFGFDKKTGLPLTMTGGACHSQSHKGVFALLIFVYMILNY